MMDRRSLDDFPDAILGQIISFLPTKLAFKTSVLSKRWRYMWKSLSNLDFHELPYDDDDGIRFMDFVDRALCVDEAPPINRFSLDCIFEDVDFPIKKWISAAVSRNVKELNLVLRYYRNDEHVFPDCLFSCETLESFQIHAYGHGVPVPSRFCLPNLKILKLKGVYFKNYFESNTILFASSRLEQFVMDTCTWLDGKPPHLIVSAPLKSFYYDGALMRDYQLCCSSSIVKATLQFDDESVTENVDCVNNVLRSLRLVKDLELSACVLEALSHVTMPLFENLTSLEFCQGPIDICCKELEMFLNQCPVLETLTISQASREGYESSEDEESEDEDWEWDWEPLSPKLTCLSSLKNVTIESLEGNTKELEVLKSLLANATSLETMEIYIEYNYRHNRKRVETSLSYVPKGSKSCKVTVMI